MMQDFSIYHMLVEWFKVLMMTNLLLKGVNDGTTLEPKK